MANDARQAARSAAILGAGLVLAILGVAEIVRIFEEGSVAAIRWVRGLLFLVSGIVFAVAGHLRLRSGA